MVVKQFSVFTLFFSLTPSLSPLFLSLSLSPSPPLSLSPSLPSPSLISHPGSCLLAEDTWCQHSDAYQSGFRGHSYP